MQGVFLDDVADQFSALSAQHLVPQRARWFTPVFTWRNEDAAQSLRDSEHHLRQQPSPTESPAARLSCHKTLSTTPPNAS